MSWISFGFFSPKEHLRHSYNIWTNYNCPFRSAELLEIPNKTNRGHFSFLTQIALGCFLFLISLLGALETIF